MRPVGAPGPLRSEARPPEAAPAVPSSQPAGTARREGRRGGGHRGHPCCAPFRVGSSAPAGPGCPFYLPLSSASRLPDFGGRCCCVSLQVGLLGRDGAASTALPSLAQARLVFGAHLAGLPQPLFLSDVMWERELTSVSCPALPLDCYLACIPTTSLLGWSFSVDSFSP